jgi:uncharacterized protein (TIGR03435 family)
MTRAVVFFTLLCAWLAIGQTQPAFEVASIRPAAPLDPQKIMSGQQKIGVQSDNARISINSMTLNDLIMIAFRVKPYQVSGPPWLSSGINAERFDVQATLPPGGSGQMPEMLQALLAERFGLKVHRETTEHNVYALVVAKGGHKMKDALPEDPVADTPTDKPNAVSVPFNGGNVTIQGGPDRGMVVRGGAGMGPMKVTMNGGSMHMENPRMSMEALTAALSRFVDRPVVDMTDLKGFYQVAFDLSTEEMMTAARSIGAGPMPMRAGGADAASDPPASSIFQSVQQMGLRLENRKAPVERIVIDKLERQPTEN